MQPYSSYDTATIWKNYHFIASEKLASDKVTLSMRTLNTPSVYWSSPVGLQNIRHCVSVDRQESSNECPVYDTKMSNGEAQ